MHLWTWYICVYHWSWHLIVHLIFVTFLCPSALSVDTLGTIMRFLQVGYDDFVAAGSLAAAREKGLVSFFKTIKYALLNTVFIFFGFWFVSYQCLFCFKICWFFSWFCNSFVFSLDRPCPDRTSWGICMCIHVWMKILSSGICGWMCNFALQP